MNLSEVFDCSSSLKEKKETEFLLIVRKSWSNFSLWDYIIGTWGYVFHPSCPKSEAIQDLSINERSKAAYLQKDMGAPKPQPRSRDSRVLPPTAAMAVWLHTSSGWFLETQATSVLHPPRQDSGPTITTILRVICGISYHEFQSQMKVTSKFSAPSCIPLMDNAEKADKACGSENECPFTMSTRERKHAQLALCRSMDIYIHTGLWVHPCEYTSIYSVGADKLVWITLGISP